MLSKYDIEKELEKGISIVPFKQENIKENSINLSASQYAWTMSEGDIFFSSENKCVHLSESDNITSTDQQHCFKKGDSCVIENEGVKYIILLPWSTTLIETEEVLAVDTFIGGTYHSKVGMVSKGLGHIGTMLGPNFSGHSLIAIHNISHNPVKICVGETFVSVVFHRLDTALEAPNATNNGHLEKFAELGININAEEREFINQDWKRNINGVREKMVQQVDYKQFLKEFRKRKWCKFLKYFSKENIIRLVCVLGFAGVTCCIAPYLDSKQLPNHSIWIERWWMIVVATILAPIISKVLA